MSLVTNTIVMAAGDGLNAYYWNFAVVDNNNEFPSGNPNLNRIEAVVDNDWQRESPANSINADKFAVRWQGSIEINETGKYVFHTQSDDGIRLWVDNQRIINNWTLHGATWNNSAAIELIAGTRYDIKMEFFEHTGRAVARLHWQTPSNTTRHVIPQSQLYSDTAETAQLVAKYDFNENWQDSGEIIDQIGTASGVVSGRVHKVTSGANGLKPDTCSAAQFSGGAIDINSLPVSTAPGDKTSLSFWMFWNGNNSVMPLGWRLHDLWLVDGKFGFNTAGSDIYGIADTGWLKNSWHHITAVFTNGNVFENKLYIDGKEQGLSHVRGTIQNSNAFVDPHLRLGGWWANNGYRFQGQIDELKIYTGKIEQSTINTNRLTASPCNSDLYHFQFEYAKNALTCQSSSITIKACGNADCSSLYPEDVTLTLSPANGWSTNPVTLTGGLVELKLGHHSAGSVVLDIISTTVPPISTLQCHGDNAIDPGCTINVADAGFVFDVPTLTACKPSANVTIKAVKKSDTSVQCVGALTGNQTLNFWSDYLSPNTGSKSAVISGTKIKQSSPGTPVNITFDNDGEATFTVQYDDAGQLQLDASFDDGNGLTLKGSDVFVSKPEALIAYSTDANAECASQNANCSKFKKAGESFNLKVNAACWTHDGDSDFTDNPVSPNFELSSIVNTHNLLAPASGSTGTLSNTSFNFTGSDNGSHTVSQTVSEVGVFEFGIIAPSYFGETLTTVVSPAIGRFYPDHFELTTQSNGSFGAHACTGFSYSGQRFSYQTSPQLIVTAYSALDPATITQNYTSDFAKLTIADFAVTPPTTDANQLGADTTNRVRLLWTPDAPDLTDNANGTLTFAFGNDSYNYLHEPNSLIDKFTNAVDLTFTAISDSDNVNAHDLPHTLQPTGETIRFGRFAISSVHGSELAPLTLSLTAEYFNGLNWVTNSADQCTTLGLSSDLQLANLQTAGGSWQAGNNTMTIANGTTSGLLTNNAPLLNGTATLTLSAPGEDNEGYVDIRSQLSITAPWLLGDYDNDGHYDDNPTGRASFGLFKGSDNIIFRREVY
ncbi:MAG: PA14 domain-containing protein [Gammaproteobacteria bacterium]|nr:PA14 domain-containing protein [Gammaproteobacteria bacterium]